MDSIYFLEFSKLISERATFSKYFIALSIKLSSPSLFKDFNFSIKFSKSLSNSAFLLSPFLIKFCCIILIFNSL